MADVDDSPLSDLSELSDAESLTTDEEIESGKLRGTLDSWVKAAAQSTKRKRPASPPHEYAPEDNPAIAVIVMFRSRFSDVFPKSLANYGPQDIERGIFGEDPEEGIEKLLASLLSLCLNRKKDVEKGHYNRALEEAISTFSRQWPSEWQGKNPLAGSTTFKSLVPEQRLSLLLALVHWSLASSELVRQVITESYKGSRDMQDKGQPLSVQPWGSDGDKRRYWLIEGLDDTFFRIYRENDPKLMRRTWWSVAKDIESAKALADKLREDGSLAAKILANGIGQAVPRWEAGEEKRRRREYRQIRKAQFSRPEPGFSLYEGRTRGKRTRYTFSEDDDMDTDGPSGKRSRQSGISTPIEHNGPTVTSSGRQVKARSGGVYGESLLSGQGTSVERGTSEAEDNRFRTRSGRASGTAQPSRHNDYNETNGNHGDSDSDVPSEEWNSDQNDDDDVDENLADIEDDEDEEMSDGLLDEDDEEIVLPSKIVTLKLGEETSRKLAESRRSSAQHQRPEAIKSEQDTTFKVEPTRNLPQRPALSTPITAESTNHTSQVNGISKPEAGQKSMFSTPSSTPQTNRTAAVDLDAGTAASSPATESTNGIHKDVHPTRTQVQSTSPTKLEALKMEDTRIRQTPTPPLSDVHQSAPGSGSASF